MLFFETQDYLSTLDEPFSAIFLDYEKAFDRISRDFIYEAMAKMGFGPNFIQGCKTLYNNTNSHLLINGQVTDQFSVSSGVRQGCPLAALLYLIGQECFADLFRTDPVFKGILVPPYPSKLGKNIIMKTLVISLFCDDTTLYCSSAQDQDRAIELLSIYELATGQKINYSKSVVLPINNPTWFPISENRK